MSSAPTAISCAATSRGTMSKWRCRRTSKIGGETLDKLDVYIADLRRRGTRRRDAVGSGRACIARVALERSRSGGPPASAPRGAANGVGVSYKRGRLGSRSTTRSYLSSRKRPTAPNATRKTCRPTPRAPRRPRTWRASSGWAAMPAARSPALIIPAKSVLSFRDSRFVGRDVIVEGAAAARTRKFGRGVLFTPDAIRAAHQTRGSRQFGSRAPQRLPRRCRSAHRPRAEMNDFRQWLKPASVFVRVLVGAGGRGKTRLALEFARAMC